MKKTIPLLLLISFYSYALPFDEMVPMSLSSYNGNNEKPSGVFGVLHVRQNWESPESPYISFQSYQFESWDDKCLIKVSDLNDTGVVASVIKLRGKNAMAGDTGLYPSYRDLDYKYGHSYVLTNISDSAFQNDYQLEVTRYFVSERAIKPHIWIFKTDIATLDNDDSPCKDAPKF